jgi:cAMP-dependent protein kinase regulator
MDDAPPAPRPAPPTAPLPKIPLFSSLSADRLRHLIERVDVRDVAAGDEIVRQGEPGRSLFVVVRGGVVVSVAGPPPVEIARLPEGAFFGELGLITDSPRSATVTADGATQLLEISREVASELVSDSPEVLRTLLRFFRDRLLERLLRTSPLFQPLPAAEAQALASRFVFLELEPKTRAVKEGERSPGLFLLLCGHAHVLQQGTVRASLSPGDLFGEMSLLTRGLATATIEATSKCWVLELKREDFQEIMVTYPQVLEYVSGLADARQAANQSRIDIL